MGFKKKSLWGRLGDKIGPNISKKGSYERYPEKQVTDHEIEKLGFDWFMRDDIPINLSNGTYILNLDSHKNSGTHWVCFCLQLPEIYYFDPFGTNLNGYPPNELRLFGKQNGFKNIICFQEDVQHLKSYLCGYYALYMATKFRKHIGNLTPNKFDNLILKTFTKYPSDKNVNSVTQWSKKVGIL